MACDGQGKVVAYYTLAATSLPLTELSDLEKKKLPRYALLPAALIGRLAVDINHRNMGLGGAMIIDAALRVSRSDPAIYALIVDAKDASAAGFYEHLGFRGFASRALTLFIPLDTVMKAIAR